MKTRLLIVDDHPMVREGLRIALTGAGMETVEAECGDLALELLLSQRIDLLLLDINLPNLNGLEVLSLIKRQYASLPVLMHSSHDRLPYIEQSYQRGASGYLVKGTDAKSVIEAVRIVLSGGSVWTAAQLRYANGES